MGSIKHSRRLYAAACRRRRSCAYPPKWHTNIIIFISMYSSFEGTKLNGQEESSIGCNGVWKDLTRFNKIATQGAPQMAVDKEANSLSRVYSYYSKFILCLFYM